MLPKKRSIKKVEEVNDNKRKKKRIDETPSSTEQKIKRPKDKFPCTENSLSNIPALFGHSNASVKVHFI